MVLVTSSRCDWPLLSLLHSDQHVAGIIEIRQASVGLSGRARTAINAFLAHLAAICSNHAAGPLPGGLVGRLDGTIAFTLQESAGETRDSALVGLAGVRSGLFPDAPIVTAAVDISIAPA
jgi:hypothetical protein